MNPKFQKHTIDGIDYILAPLKMNEIETLVEGSLDPNVPYSEKRERTWKTIHASLSRAAQETGALVPSIEELKQRLDLDQYLELHGEVLAVSKMRVPKPS